MAGNDYDSFAESLSDNGLYSIGAYFSDGHPELVDEVIERSTEIERQGLRHYADQQGLSYEECFQTLLTGLAVRYFKSIVG